MIETPKNGRVPFGSVATMSPRKIGGWVSFIFLPDEHFLPFNWEYKCFVELEWGEERLSIIQRYCKLDINLYNMFRNGKNRGVEYFHCKGWNAKSKISSRNRRQWVVPIEKRASVVATRSSRYHFTLAPRYSRHPFSTGVVEVSARWRRYHWNRILLSLILYWRRGDL